MHLFFSIYLCCLGSFAYDRDLRPGQLISASNYSNYKSIPAGERFGILVRYNRKIDGKTHMRLISSNICFDTFMSASLAFRALGRLLGAARDLMVLTGDHGNLVNFEEQAQFDTQGYALHVVTLHQHC